MSILVTGGAGFIGSNIVDVLIERGYQVAVLDDLSTGFRENINPKAKFYEASVCDGRAVAGVFEQEKPDFVSHQAAQIDVRKSVDDPVFDADVNIVGGLNIITNAAKSGVKKIVYASTVAVYGEPQSLPVAESHQIEPTSPYGISKHTVERYLCLYSVLYGLKFTALRYPNVYGPRQNPHGEAGVVAIFVNRLLEGEQPTIYGDGEQTRDYAHVYDVVEANISALTRGDNKAYNIGTGIETSVNETFLRISKALRSDLTALHAQERAGEIRRMVLDASRARTELGWTPKFNFEDGVSQTAQYYRERTKPKE